MPSTRVPSPATPSRGSMIHRTEGADHSAPVVPKAKGGQDLRPARLTIMGRAEPPRTMKRRLAPLIVP